MIGITEAVGAVGQSPVQIKNIPSETDHLKGWEKIKEVEVVAGQAVKFDSMVCF
ncbi:hypothetical protein RND59_00095 [Vibrio ruber]|uniref:hypothetical protein n=1 Tax=Vibrio ruber TaxID=184755 RepID=UPI0028932DAD|nr:hypothetical protein [Vibrio ruber]WNJ95560.1 hypothetical protein RND59_00095 [Vibrio ruber]